MDASSGEQTRTEQSGTAGESQSQPAGEQKPAETSNTDVATETSTPAAATASGKVIDTTKTDKPRPTPGAKTVVGVEDYERRRAEALTAKPKEAAKPQDGAQGTDRPTSTQGKPADGQKNEPVKGREGEPATGEPAGPPEGGTSSERQSTPAATAEETAETEDAKLPDRIRLGGLSDTDRAYIATAKQIALAEKISFTDALLRVSGKTAAKVADKEPGSTSASDTDALQRRTVEQIKADIAAKKAEKKAAAGQLDTSKMTDLDDELDTLRDELELTRRANEEATWLAERDQETAFNTAVNQSKTRTIEVYPDAGKDDSALSKKMIEIADLMEQQANPLVFEADAPFKIAQMAANELGIAPKAKGAAPSTTKESSTPATGAAATNKAAAKPQGVRQEAVVSKPAGGPAAAGSARTTSGGNGQTGIKPGKIRTVEEYESVLAGLGVRQ